MANDPEMYVVDSNGSLASIDLATGTTSIIAKPNVPLISLAFSPTGQLYGTDGTALYSIDSATGNATEIGTFGNSVSLFSIRFSGSGTLYASNTRTLPTNVPFFSFNLYVVNPQTGAANLIGHTNYNDTPTINPQLGQLTFAGGSLYVPELDKVQGSATVTVNIKSNAYYEKINPSNVAYLSSSQNTNRLLSTTFSGPRNILYGINGNAIDSINTITGSATQVSTFDSTGLASIVSAASPTEAAPQGGVYIADGTTGRYSYAPASPYSGPTSEFVTNTSDILNVTALVPNAFIEVGYIPGQQTAPSEGGINVSFANGNNVLDGYAGSNFLTGGSGNDTFYVDDRTLAQNSWSTVANFHAGDGVTMWGVTAANFAAALDGKGASGYQGLTLVFNAGQQTAAVTLAGYTSADLFNGRLDVSYGATSATGGVPGATFMHIQGG